LAISSPLLDVSVEGARGVLLNVSGGPDLTLQEVSDAASAISAAVDPSANIIFGAVVLPRHRPELKITLIATGLRPEPSRQPGHATSGPDRRELAERPTGRFRSTPQPPPTDDDEEDDLDRPAFLRRRRLG
jgi:cell division protein FtsZ